MIAGLSVIIFLELAASFGHAGQCGCLPRNGGAAIYYECGSPPAACTGRSEGAKSSDGEGWDPPPINDDGASQRAQEAAVQEERARIEKERLEREAKELEARARLQQEESERDLRAGSENKARESYIRTVGPPAACVIEETLGETGVCSFINDVALVAALAQSESSHEFWRRVLEKALKKFVVLSFPKGMNLKSKLELVRALYEAESREFSVIADNIRRELTEDSKKHELLKELAKLDADGVELLKRTIMVEQQKSVDDSQAYLQIQPDAPGVRFNCSDACSKLIQAAKITGTW